MTRFRRTINILTGEETTSPFTTEEEAAADAAGAATRFRPLEAWQVWAVCDIVGLDVLAGINASAADATTKAIARNQWKAPPGGYFTRSNPLFSLTEFLTAFSMTSGAVDAMWDSAAALLAPS